VHDSEFQGTCFNVNPGKEKAILIFTIFTKAIEKADADELSALIQARMPFGKYKGWLLLDLPEAYLVWFAQRGFPHGKLGQQLRSTLEIKANGLLGVLDPLRKRGQDPRRPGGQEPE
jgi:uncharacterized protein (DUF3820 family)